MVSLDICLKVFGLLYFLVYLKCEYEKKFFFLAQEACRVRNERQQKLIQKDPSFKVV
jgi:hypothetical protein